MNEQLPAPAATNTFERIKRVMERVWGNGPEAEPT
jgi:hypothetical protein